MSRIPNRLLEHSITVRALRAVGSSVGDKFEAAVPRKAIVVDKRTKVRDQREGSATKGEEIMANTHVLVQPEHYVTPGSLVVVWPGTPMEREGEVVATAYGKHSIAPSSAQFWLV